MMVRFTLDIEDLPRFTRLLLRLAWVKIILIEIPETEAV